MTRQSYRTTPRVTKAKVIAHFDSFIQIEATFLSIRAFSSDSPTLMFHKLESHRHGDRVIIINARTISRISNELQVEQLSENVYEISYRGRKRHDYVKMHRKRGHL